MSQENVEQARRGLDALNRGGVDAVIDLCDPEVPIAFDRAGRGEPLLLVHANGMSRRAWIPVLSMLSRERDVIAIDLPGHGASPPVPPHVTPGATEADALEAAGLRE